MPKETPISRSVRIWAPDPLVKLFPELGYPAGAPRTMRLEAARGEVVSGQIALRCEGIRFKNHDGVDGCGVDRVDIAPLALAGRQPGAGGIPVEARWVGHTHVPTAARGVAPERLEGKAPGFYPDPLYPVHQTITNPHHYNPDHSAALVNGRTQGLWLTLRVPRDAVPGDYTGEAQVKIAYFGDILRVSIRLRVYAAVLPLCPSCGVENWFVLASVVRQHECQWFDARFWTLVEAYLRNLADHRETHLVVPMYELIGFLPAAGGGLRLDWANFDRFVDLALQAGLIFLSGNHLATYTYGTPWYACGVHTYRNHGGSVRYELHEGRTPAAQRWLAWFLPRLRDHLSEKGWLQRWWQHVRDEPGGEMLADYEAIRAAVKRYAPEFRTMDAINGPVIDACDCWVPTLDSWLRNLEFFRERQALGEQVWTYVCCGPTGLYANRFIDQKTLLPRLLFWIMARYGASGYLHWGYNWSHLPVPELDARIFLPALGPVQSGDVCVVYPGPHGPHDSIRWEMQREGLQDFELFRQLAEQSPRRAAAILAQVVRGFTDYDTDIAAFRRARRRLLEALSKVTPAASGRRHLAGAAGRALPEFKPIPLPAEKRRAFTLFAQEMLVSRLLPSAGRLEALAYPAGIERLGLRQRTFTHRFCDLHVELAASAPRDRLVYLACRLECPASMRLAVCLGYDGPVKLWIDGREAFHDANGTNPAQADAARIPLRASPGGHDILIALGTNQGRAWGIFLRCERLDLSRRQLERGPEAYALPQFTATPVRVGIV